MLTIQDLLTASYLWADSHALVLAAAALAVPALGTLLAYLGRGGETDADGRVIANVVIGFGVLVGLVELIAIWIGYGLMERSLLDANALLLLSPIVCLVGCVLGIRLVFPLSELGSVKTLVDVGTFALACVAVLWVLSRFRGWSVVFFGGIGQLLAVGVLTLFLLRRLFHRAVGSDRLSMRDPRI